VFDQSKSALGRRAFGSLVAPTVAESVQQITDSVLDPLDLFIGQHRLPGADSPLSNETTSRFVVLYVGRFGTLLLLPAPGDRVLVDCPSYRFVIDPRPQEQEDLPDYSNWIGAKILEPNDM